MHEILLNKGYFRTASCTVREAIFLRLATFLFWKGDLSMSTESKKTRKAYRQGELLFVPLNGQELGMLDFEPKNMSYPSWKKLDTNVLREGEATGHKHEVISQTPAAVTMMAPDRQLIRGLPDMDFVGSEDRLLVAQEPVEVVHPEHRTLRLPKGSFLVVIQREYDEVRARRIRD